MNKWAKGMMNFIMGMITVLIIFECKEIGTWFSYLVLGLWIIVNGIIFVDINKDES